MVGEALCLLLALNCFMVNGEQREGDWRGEGRSRRKTARGIRGKGSHQKTEVEGGRRRATHIEDGSVKSRKVVRFEGKCYICGVPVKRVEREGELS